MAIILDAEPTDVPPRYREPERARRLVSVPCDAVRRGGVVICPAKEWEVQDYAREERCRVAVFAPDGDVTARDKKVAHSAAWVDGGRIVLECCGQTVDGGALRADAPAAAQVAGALAVFTLDQLLGRASDDGREADRAADPGAPRAPDPDRPTPDDRATTDALPR
jgi:hypothetical protein